MPPHKNPPFSFIDFLDFFQPTYSKKCQKFAGMEFMCASLKAQEFMNLLAWVNIEQARRVKHSGRMSPIHELLQDV